MQGSDLLVTVSLRGPSQCSEAVPVCAGGGFCYLGKIVYKPFGPMGPRHTDRRV